MMKNPDGTLYSGETIAQLLVELFDARPFPPVGHILGSDWGFGTHYTDAESYRRAVYRRAAEIYPNEGGWL